MQSPFSYAALCGPRDPRGLLFDRQKFPIGKSAGKARENLGNIAGSALANRKPFHLLNPD
ncbi:MULTISPECIES: hypothetical protein [unclassified Paraburkholderia]|uniref:hypothetical protein n=1 Tax=unclassified Paraburkholderia TaxID=2615204 RepID=UPI002AAFEC20|nr:MULTISPECIES: hypothetical protein [unclassified Paraburkholderia]